MCLLCLSKLIYFSNLKQYIQGKEKKVWGDEKRSEGNQVDGDTCREMRREWKMTCAKSGATYVTSAPSKWKCGYIR